MTSHMICQMFFPCILLSTYCTMVRCFTSMPHDVIHEMFFSRKGFLANFTSMGSFSGVFSDMIHHVFFPCEGFCTILTSVRRLSSMTPRKTVLRFFFKLSNKIHVKIQNIVLNWEVSVKHEC